MASVSTTQRPTTLTVAAIILGLLSLFSLATPLLATTGGPPLVIVIIAVVFGIAGLAATVGLWQRRRWAAWVAGIVTALNALSSIPGLTASLNAALFASVIVTLVGAVPVIVLVVLPSSRRAYR